MLENTTLSTKDQPEAITELIVLSSPLIYRSIKEVPVKICKFIISFTTRTNKKWNFPLSASRIIRNYRIFHKNFKILQIYISKNPQILAIIPHIDLSLINFQYHSQWLKILKNSRDIIESRSIPNTFPITSLYIKLFIPPTIIHKFSKFIEKVQ